MTTIEKHRKELYDACIKSPKIRQNYIDYVLKDIPFEDWVQGMVNHLIREEKHGIKK